MPAVVLPGVKEGDGGSLSPQYAVVDESRIHHRDEPALMVTVPEVTAANCNCTVPAVDPFLMVPMIVARPTWEVKV